jgi:cyclophilin family peptidyl-prolyl cis-trans isomerase
MAAFGTPMAFSFLLRVGARRYLYMSKLIASARRASSFPKSSPAFIESLETRLFLAAHISSITADNRGLVQLFADAALNSSTVTSSSCGIFTIGADGKWGTTDDVKLSSTVSYSSALKRIQIKASSMTVNGAYRVRLLATKIKGMDGAYLDGEYSSTGKSGNGTAGGNYDVVCRATTSDPIAVFTTTDGVLKVKLFRTNASVTTTVNNFLLYANYPVWDNTFFHRKTTNASDGISVIQGGGFAVKSNNTLDFEPSTPQGIALQAGISNLRGTIAMARGTATNSATNQWFFNYQNNTVLDPHPELGAGHDGYAVFGQVTNATLKVLDLLAAHDRVEIHGDPNVSVAIQNQLSPESFTGSGIYPSTVPVVSAATFHGHADVLNPKADLVRVTRVAIAQSISKTPISTAATAARSLSSVAAPTPQAAPTPSTPTATAATFSINKIILSDDPQGPVVF